MDHASMSDMSGMGMDSGMSNSTTAMHMATAFTTALGSSNLWFTGWTPSSAGATFGACLGLAFLAALSRFLSAVKVCAEIAWAQNLHQRRSRVNAARSGPIALPDDAVKTEGQDQGNGIPAYSRSPVTLSPSSSSLASAPARSSEDRPPFSPPFSLAIDLPRSLLFGLQAFIAYLLMLAVMTFNAYFLIAILVGLVGGEMAFGRYIALLGYGAQAHGGHGFDGTH
ncbi:hypothetical protein BMF94_4829 [Rhodotorula taiwanensis]|uniref:Copper transport protein n=1 Tax=Rhodotorula taiwanensis TaxID=741276 RepID=A0A2S5B5P7_9BASI|nr:hypothetical protein BMF94_4829 [Rhodotorula taiwanensis]